MRGVRLFILLVLCAAMLGSVVIPNIEPLLAKRATAKTQIVGARGPLSAAQSKAALQRAGVQDDEMDAMRRHLTIEQEVAETPLVVGNKTRILRDGENTFRAMFTAIKDAKDHVNLEYYILEDIESDGVMLSDLLVSKSRDGVAVNVIYDSFGSSNTPSAFFDKIAEAGGKLVSFNPINPLETKIGYKPNDRDHRKILIADGRVGIVGGINLSSTYLSSSIGKSGAGGGGKPKSQETDYWHDTDLQITGPVVSQLQELFLEHWADQKGPPLNQGNFFPKVAAAGGEIVRIIGSAADHDVPRYYVTLLSAIRTAEKSIFLTSAYFVPTRQEKKDLIAAAKRGVDVRFFLPGKSDASLALSVQRSHYGRFLKAGVKIYEDDNQIVHTKAVVIDGVWSVIGSSNLDHRSVLFNDEVDAVVIGRETGAEMERLFQEDIARATPVSYRKWRARPLLARLKESFARLWEKLL